MAKHTDAERRELVEGICRCMVEMGLLALPGPGDTEEMTTDIVALIREYEAKEKKE